MPPVDFVPLTHPPSSNHPPIHPVLLRRTAADSGLHSPPRSSCAARHVPPRAPRAARHKPPRAPRTARQSHGPPSALTTPRASADAASIGCLRLMWWNAQGLGRHVPHLSRFLRDCSIDLCGVVETWLYHQSVDVPGFRWCEGPSRPPHSDTSRVRHGVGSFSRDGLLCVSVRTDRHSFWVRLDLADRSPLFVCTVYAPQPSDALGRSEM